MEPQNAIEQIAICRLYCLLEGEMTTVGGSTPLSASTDFIELKKFGDGTGTLQPLGFIPRDGMSFEPKEVDQIKTYRAKADNSGYTRGKTIEVTTDHTAVIKLDAPTELLNALIFSTDVKPIVKDTNGAVDGVVGRGGQFEAVGSYKVGVTQRRVTGLFMIEMFSQDKLLRSKLWFWGEAYVAGKTDYAGNKQVMPELTIDIIGEISGGQFATSAGGFLQYD